jgi:hypothetical protein
VRPVICAISILRIPKTAPIGWIVAFVNESCVLPVGGRLHLVEDETEFILDIEGMRPEHPFIHGGYCDCGIRQGFCTQCCGQGWVAWWTNPTVEEMAADIARWLDRESGDPTALTTR